MPAKDPAARFAALRRANIDSIRPPDKHHCFSCWYESEDRTQYEHDYDTVLELWPPHTPPLNVILKWGPEKDAAGYLWILLRTLQREDAHPMDPPEHVLLCPRHRRLAKMGWRPMTWLGPMRGELSRAEQEEMRDMLIHPSGGA